jgi:hypothetical protein
MIKLNRLPHFGFCVDSRGSGASQGSVLHEVRNMAGKGEGEYVGKWKMERVGQDLRGRRKI